MGLSTTQHSNGKAYRCLTVEEKFKAYEISLKQGFCCFCNTRSYCAEQLCNCVESKWIQSNTTLDKNICHRKHGSNQKVRLSKKDRLKSLYPNFFDLYDVVYPYVGKKHGLPHPSSIRSMFHWGDDISTYRDYVIYRATTDLKDEVF